MIYPTYKNCDIWRSFIVEVNDVNRFLTDAGSYKEATNTFLLTREQDWEARNPKPIEARFIQEWIERRLNELYPEKYFEIDGKEFTEEKALQTGIKTWTIQLRVLFEQELSELIEKEFSQTINK